MGIKVGDIVEYKGVRQRVMGIHPSGSVRLSKQYRRNWYAIKDVTLIESFVPSDIQEGDYVRILDIPKEEINFWDNANKPIAGDIFQVDYVNHTLTCGDVIHIRVNDETYWFMTPYVEKIRDYDMI